MWRSPTKYVAFRREPDKGAFINLHDGARAEKTKTKGRNRGNILSCVAYVSVCGPLLKCLSWLSKLLLQGIWMPYNNFQQRAGGGKHWSEFLLGVWGTSYSSFPVRFLPLKTKQALPLTEHNMVHCIIWSHCGSAANTFFLLTKMNSFYFWHCVTLWRVCRIHAQHTVVTYSVFLGPFPGLFPKRETSGVSVVGRIFPGANHTKGWICLVLWALLSVKPSNGRDCFQIFILPVVGKVAFSIHSGGQHYFQCVIQKGEKRKK